MSAVRSREFRSASRRVLIWCDFYTRGLDSRVAGERRDEIASDLHDHARWADDQGVPTRRLGRQVLARAVRGVPSDVSWRRAQLRADVDARRALAERRVDGTFDRGVLLGGALVAATGVFLLIRIARALLIGDVDAAPSHTLQVVGVTAVALVATAMLTRRRSRVAGALLLAPTSALLAFLAVGILYRVSATGTMIVARLSDYGSGPHPWLVLVLALGGGTALAFVGAAIVWWPKRVTRTSAVTEPRITEGTS
jgi:uncharacterized membrane protein (GlpM family)